MRVEKEICLAQLLEVSLRVSFCLPVGLLHVRLLRESVIGELLGAIRSFVYAFCSFLYAFLCEFKNQVLDASAKY